jgi:hypothetical protein
MADKKTAGSRRPEDYLKEKPLGKGTETTVIYREHAGKIFKTPRAPANMQAASADVGGLTDCLGVTGNLTLIHRDADGNVKSEETLENVITYTGLKYLSQLASGQVSSPFKYIQIGTGGKDPNDPLSILAPDPSNTKLVAFYEEGLAVATNTEVLNNAERGYQAIARFAYTFDFTEEVHINEACIAVDSHVVDSTPILNRRTFFDRIMQNLDFLEVVWEIAFTRYPKDKVT